MLNLDKYPIPNESVVSADLDDQSVVLLKIDGTEFYSLNSTAARIWQLVTGFNSINDIIKIFSKEYNASFSKIKESVLRQINEFINEDLICLVEKKSKLPKKKTRKK